MPEIPDERMMITLELANGSSSRLKVPWKSRYYHKIESLYQDIVIRLGNRDPLA